VSGSLAAMAELIVPTAFEPSAVNPQADIFNRLLKSRIVMLGQDVNDDVANQLCAQLLFLDAEDRREPSGRQGDGTRQGTGARTAVDAADVARKLLR